MVLPALDYQPQQIEAQRAARAQAALASYDAGASASVAKVAAAGPYQGVPGQAGLHRALTDPAGAQAAKGMAQTNAMWNRYNAGYPQHVQDWITGIDQAGNEQRLYWRAAIDQQAKDRAAALARARSGGGGRGGGGGGRRGGGGRKAAAGNAFYTPGPVAPSFDQWLAQHGLGGGGAPAASGAAPSYTPAPLYQQPPKPVATPWGHSAAGL